MVRLYTQPGCGPCASLKASFRRAGVAFEEINVRESDGALAFMKANDITSTPFVQYVDADAKMQHFVGLIPERIAEIKGLYASTAA